MMYSPDIPTASAGNIASTDDGGGSGGGGGGLVASCRPTERRSLENYYAKIETEESMKCLVSSLLFFLVLIAFFLVALLMNPEM